ncbi:hypothetical protein KY289_017721 [Solanum tuberosum]|nr:hypothetical protein KY289_017721 [Solanum tuberosum]
MIEVNSTLRLLTIFDSKSITATPLISAVLARNRSMEVHIWNGENNEKTSKVVEFVPENSTLRIYRLNVSGACRVACALGMNSTVKTLDLTGVWLKSRGAKEFRWVLEQNRTLKEINLSNTCLKDKRSCLCCSWPFQEPQLAEAVNPWIEDIDISRTALHNAGKTEAIYQRLGQNDKAEPEIDLLKGMPMTEPKSCRVFLCGQEYAGQQEFYALHDLMFPGHGRASIFLIISSLFRKPNNREQKTPDEVEEDLQYWLRFIVSNSKRALQQCMLPNVTVVLTHYDKINQLSQNLQLIVDSIRRLRDKFQGFVEFYSTVFTVDARSSASVNWRLENHNKPAVKWKEFGDLCQVKAPLLRVRSRLDNKEKVETRRRAVATCLHHIG